MVVWVYRFTGRMQVAAILHWLTDEWLAGWLAGFTSLSVHVHFNNVCAPNKSSY